MFSLQALLCNRNSGGSPCLPQLVHRGQRLQSPDKGLVTPLCHAISQGNFLDAVCVPVSSHKNHSGFLGKTFQKGINCLPDFHAGHFLLPPSVRNASFQFLGKGHHRRISFGGQLPVQPVKRQVTADRSQKSIKKRRPPRRNQFPGFPVCIIDTLLRIFTII